MSRRRSRSLPPLRDILHTAVANGASDVHIRAGAPPLIRVSGDLWPLELPELTSEDTERIVLATLPSAEDRANFLADHECDCALTEPGVGRFRVNAYRSRGAAAMVLRHVKEVIPSFEELGLPQDLPRARAPTQRAGPGVRADGVGQDDDARGHDRRDQCRAALPHPHHRGPDRVPAQQQVVHRQPA